MRKLINNTFGTGLVLLLTLQFTQAFSLIGPGPGGGLAGDNWEAQVIGYGLTAGPIGVDVGTPKNLGEEYRRVTPVMFYAMDASFLDFYGLAGSTNVDLAFAMANGPLCGQTNAILYLSSPTNGVISDFANVYAGTPVTLGPLNNLNAYPADLPDFPLEAQQINPTAQALALTDLKSSILELLTEQLGLTEPDRYAWTLHDRFLPPAGKCPADVSYLVVQRNYDVIDSPLNQVQYSPYVNGTLYGFDINEFCNATASFYRPNNLAIALPVPVDEFAESFSAVASFGLQLGGFYTSLTRDDVAGLRYLYSTNNVNFEATAPSGGQLLTTNPLTPLVITTLSYGLFLSQLTNDPAALQTLYPDLQIGSVLTNYGVGNITVITPTFTNFPGQTVTNFQAPALLLTNYDLSLFSSLAQTSSPAALLALYPQLVILSSSQLYFTNFPTPNISTYLTNAIGSPFPPVPIQVTVTNGFSPNIFPVFGYTFGNIVTNYFATSNRVTIQTVTVTNYAGSPVGSPVSTNVTTVTKILTNNISGDFFLIPTNWCGYAVVQKVWEQKIPSYTNVLAASSNTNTLGSAQFSQNTIFYYTNRIWAVEPGVCEPTLIFTTNQSTTFGTNYQYTFGNLFTGPPTHQFTNTLVTVIITNISATSTNSAGTLTTNVTTTTSVVPGMPSGDFFIIPAAWTCGFDIQRVVSTNQVATTNTVVTPIPAGVTDIGQQYSITVISTYTNHVLLIQPFSCQLSTPPPALRQGIGRLAFIRANYDSLLGQFFQPLTNNYTMVMVTNSQPVTEYYQRVVTVPDFLLRASDLAAGPSGATAIGSLARNLPFDSSQAPPQLAGPGTIIPTSTFTFNKVGTIFLNGSQSVFNLATNEFLTQNNQSTNSSFLWGSFDLSTNAPVLYPNGTSIANLAAQLYIQVSPPSLFEGDGTNGVPYGPVTFTATGGQPPYMWAAPNFSTSVPGLTFNTGTQTISGTPLSTGTFNFVVQVTDAANRVVNLNYSITIH